MSQWKNEMIDYILIETSVSGFTNAIVGTVDDLYDFNYSTGTLALSQMGAAMQFGLNSGLQGRTGAGEVFLTTTNVDSTIKYYYEDSNGNPHYQHCFDPY